MLHNDKKEHKLRRLERTYVTPTYFKLRKLHARTPLPRTSKID